MERRKKREERRSKGEKQKEKSMQGRRRDECAEIRVQQSDGCARPPLGKQR